MYVERRADIAGTFDERSARPLEISRPIGHNCSAD